jgi:hypothetical protein
LEQIQSQNMTNDHRPLRIGVWAAVSSKAQASEDEVSLDDQIRSGHEFAQAVGGEVVATFAVPGHTRDIIFWHDAEASMPAHGHPLSAKPPANTPPAGST